MYAFSADTSTILQKEIRKTGSRQKQLLRTSLKTGYARHAGSARNISKRNAESSRYLSSR